MLLRGNLMAEDQPQQNQVNRDAISIKKTKIKKIREFLDMKIKIHQLISLMKLDEAKTTYNSLYLTYQDILKVATPTETKKLQTDLSSIYSALMNSLTSKKVKRHLEEVPKEKSQLKNQKKTQKKIVTTDFDIILKIIEEKGKLGLSEIQSLFNINRRLAEEWVQILNDYGLVEIKYLPVGGIEVTKISNPKKNKK